MPSRTLSDFISEIKRDGLARQNRFSVMFNPPKGLLTAGHPMPLIHLFCEQVVLPSITFASQPVKTFGEDREVVYDRNFEDIPLTFLVDKNMYVKAFFDKWSELIIDPGSRLTGFYEDYTTTITVFVQDIDDKDVYTSAIFEAYPKTIAAVQLDNNSKDVMKLTVTFAYKYHLNGQRSTSGGEPQILSQYRPLQSTELIPTEQSIESYLRGSVALPSNIPELYFSNFSEYQQIVNDGFSARNATSLLERSGFTSGIGGLFI